MNMSIGPQPTPEQRLSQIHTEKEAIKRYIQQHFRSMTQQTLTDKAREWGWSVVPASKHRWKVERKNYIGESIPGKRPGASIPPPEARSILLKLAQPIDDLLNQEAQSLKFQINQAQIGELLAVKAAQEKTIQQQQEQLLRLHQDIDVGLELAADVEQNNLVLNQQITGLMKERVELQVTKQKLTLLMQEYAELSQKLSFYAAVMKRWEVRLKAIEHLADTLPVNCPIRQKLLEILKRLEDENNEPS